MDDRDNYAVIGLAHYDALISELAVLRYDNERQQMENQRLQLALDAAVAKHMEIQEHMADDIEDGTE